MTPAAVATELTALKSKVDAHVLALQGHHVGKVAEKAELLLVWIDYLRSTTSNAGSSRLLDAVQGAIIEVAGCLALGLVRPAIFSLRIQLELQLAWIYFNDHPVEWMRVEDGEHDFPMRAFFLKYLGEFGTRFSDRFKLLEKHSKRTKKDPYGVLSVHVHSTSKYAAPQMGPLSSIVQTAQRCDECVELQFEVAEYATDILASWFADRWQDLPARIQSDLQGRLGAKLLKEFCT